MKIKLDDYMKFAKIICEQNKYDYKKLEKMCVSYNDECIYFLVSPNDSKEIPNRIILDDSVKMIQVLKIINDPKGFKYEIYNDSYIK